MNLRTAGGHWTFRKEWCHFLFLFTLEEDLMIFFVLQISDLYSSIVFYWFESLSREKHQSSGILGISGKSLGFKVGVSGYQISRSSIINVIDFSFGRIHSFFLKADPILHMLFNQ